MSADPLPLLLRSFNLTTMAARYAEILASAVENHWGYRKFLLQLCESEAADPKERKRDRLLKESGLPAGKTFGTLDEEKLPVKIRRLLPTLLEGGWVERAENLLAFGLPGRGKTHCLAALGRELILRHEYTVCFTPTSKLVQQLLAARRELRLEALLKKLDRYAVIALDDLGCVQQSREEMEVLFTFLAERYERRSVMVSSNSGLLETGPDLQGPDDDHGGDRSPGASRGDPGVRQRQRPGRTGQRQNPAKGDAATVKRPPCGCAPGWLLAPPAASPPLHRRGGILSPCCRSRGSGEF